MKIALIGYGKMGRAVEALATERGHIITAIIDQGEEHKFGLDDFLQSDVAIEFTMPSEVEKNIDLSLNNGIRVVSGTTGWDMNTSRYKDLCVSKKSALLFASNFSIGVNIFFEINRRLSKLMDGFTDYNAEIFETHHIHKLDQPSGTAVSLAKEILQSNSKYSDWSLQLDKNQTKLPVFAKREGEVFGNHSVRWESDIDYIEIKHSAKSRKGFALGAVLAAEFINNKTGVFTMKDLLNI